MSLFGESDSGPGAVVRGFPWQAPPLRLGKRESRHQDRINKGKSETQERYGVHSPAQLCECVPCTDDKPEAIKAIKLVVSWAPDNIGRNMYITLEELCT